MQYLRMSPNGSILMSSKRALKTLHTSNEGRENKPKNALDWSYESLKMKLSLFSQ